MTTGTGNPQIMFGEGPPVALAPQGTRYFNTGAASGAGEWVMNGGSWLNVGNNVGNFATVALLTAAGAFPAGASTKGLRASVNDSNAAFTAGIGAVLAGGGVNVVPCFCDGTNWRIG